jgi:hypothetical protein
MIENRRNDAAWAVEAVRGSHLWAPAQWLKRVGTASAADSKVLTMVRRCRAGYERLTARERFRATAVAVSVAAAAHALLLGLVPLALRPAVPRAWWLVVSCAAAIAAVRKGGRDQASDA